MNNQPIETKNYVKPKKPKKPKQPIAMLVLGFVIGAAFATGSFWAGAFYAVGIANQNVLGTVQTTVQSKETTTAPDWRESVGLAHIKISNTTCEITGMGTCWDTKVSIPKRMEGLKVTSIGKSAFRNCDLLTSITIPEGVTSLGDYAFYYCSNLTSIMISESVTGIGSYAFRDCSSLTSITIPKGVTGIGTCTFDGCSSLTSISVPYTVTSIADYALSDCESLTSISYTGTIVEWQRISKHSYWDYGTHDYTVYCIDGTITKDGTVTYN